MKGQMSMFMIIGVIIVITIGIAIYTMSKSTEVQKTITVTPDKTGKQVCVKDAAEAAIEELAKRGGTKTSSITIPFLSPQDNISIGIKRNGGNSYVNLQPLCLKNGSNKKENGNESCMTQTYQTSSQANTSVIQYDLQESIKQYITSCGIYENVTVVFGDKDVKVITENMSVDLPIRFKQLYNLAYTIAKQDASVSQFDKRLLTTPGASLLGCATTLNTENECIKNNFSISIQQDDFAGQVVNVTDNKQKVNGRPLTIRFAIENRPPVFALTQKKVPFSVAIGSSEVIANITIADPDENQVTVACNGDTYMVASCSLIGTALSGTTIPLNGIGKIALSADAMGTCTPNSMHYLFVIATDTTGESATKQFGVLCV